MKVIYEFYLDDPENNDDRTDLKIIQNANNMYLAITELDDVCRSLRKGYVYQKDEEEDEAEAPYCKINVDLLLDNLHEILSDSNVMDIN